MVQRLLDVEYEKRVTLCQDLIEKVESDENFFIKVHFFYLTFILVYKFLKILVQASSFPEKNIIDLQ